MAFTANTSGSEQKGILAATEYVATHLGEPLFVVGTPALVEVNDTSDDDPDEGVDAGESLACDAVRLLAPTVGQGVNSADIYVAVSATPLKHVQILAQHVEVLSPANWDYGVLVPCTDRAHVRLAGTAAGDDAQVVALKRGGA